MNGTWTGHRLGRGVSADPDIGGSMDPQRIALVVLAVALVATGCDGDAAYAVTPPPATAGMVVGTAESVDDVGEAARTPIADAWLVLVPDDQAARIWRALEFEPDASQLPTVGGMVLVEVLADATLVEVADGQFAADPADGDYLVCLLDGTGPFSLRGCAEQPVSGPATWRISHGEGGLALTTS